MNELPQMLGDAELNELDTFLRARANRGSLMLDGVHGLLTALAIGPVSVTPEEWLPQILDEPFADSSEGQRVLGLLARLNDSIPAALSVAAYQPILGELDSSQVMGPPDEPAITAAGWCDGFSRGIDLRAALWEKRLAEDPQLMDLMQPIMALAVDEGVLSADVEVEQLSEDEYDSCLQQVPRVLDAVADYWRQQAPSDDECRDARQRHREAVPRSRDGHWLH